MDHDEPICKYCFDTSFENNPLIDPCNCTGSMKFVHVQCMQRWRTNPINDAWMYKCQLCLTDYAIYLRWHKEQMPIITPLLKILTERHALLAFILYYLHLTLLSFHPSVFRKNNSPYVDLQNIYFTPISYNIYHTLIVVLSVLYINTYYYSFWKYVNNKKMYIYLWFSCIGDELFQTPLMILFQLVISAFLSYAAVIPFLFMYTYALASMYRIHVQIINHINARAEIF